MLVVPLVLANEAFWADNLRTTFSRIILDYNINSLNTLASFSDSIGDPIIPSHVSIFRV